MKIAVFHELHAGGARRTVKEFAKHLKKNHQVDLYVVDEKDNKSERAFFTNVFYYNFTPKKWTGGDWKIKLYKDSIELHKLYKLHQKIAKEINKKSYDIAFIHPSKFTQAPFILRFINVKKIYYCQESLRIVYDPLIVSMDNIPSLKRLYEYLNRTIRKYIDKKNISYADYILVNSRNSQNAVKNAYGLKSFVCYLGVDSNLFKPMEIKKNYDVLFIGNKDARSGYPLFSSAIKLMKRKTKIYIKLRNNMQFTDTELSQLYNKSRILVAMTLNEPFGLIPLEAMACRVPVVAINEGGYKESVIHSKTGFLVPRDTRIIAQKLDWILAHPNNAKKMGEKGREEILKKWNWEIATERLERILKNIKNDSL